MFKQQSKGIKNSEKNVK